MTPEQKLRQEFLRRLRDGGGDRSRALTTRQFSLDEGQVNRLRQALSAAANAQIGAEVVLERVTIASSIPIIRNIYGDEYQEVLDIRGADLGWLETGNAPMQWYSHYSPQGRGEAGHVGNLRNPQVEERDGYEFLVADFVFYPSDANSRAALERVATGLTRNISVGWSAQDDGIEVSRIELPDGSRQTLVVFRAWQPDEATWVAVPADRTGAGVGRTDTPHNPNNPTGNATMPTRNDNPNGDGVNPTPESQRTAQPAPSPAPAPTPERADQPAPAPAPAPRQFAVIPGDQQLRASEQMQRAGVPDEARQAVLERAAENSQNGFMSRGDFATAVLDALDAHQRASQPEVTPSGSRAPAVHGERQFNLGRVLQEFAGGTLGRQDSLETDLLCGDLEAIGGRMSARELVLPPNFLARDAKIRARMVRNLLANPRTAPMAAEMQRAAVAVGSSQDGVFTPELDESDLIMALYDVVGLLGEIPRISELLDRDYRVAKQTGDAAPAIVNETGTINPDDGTIALNTHMEITPTTATATQSTTYLAITQSASRAAQVIRDIIQDSSIPRLMNRAVHGAVDNDAFDGIMKFAARSGGGNNRVSFGADAATFAAATGGILSYAKLKLLTDKAMDNNLPGDPILFMRGKTISDGFQIAKPITVGASSKPALFITEGGVTRFDDVRVVRDNTLPNDFTGALSSNAFARDASAANKFSPVLCLHTAHLRLGLFTPLRIEEERLPRSQKVNYIGAQTFGYGRRYDIAEVVAPNVKAGIA